jgi:hypothetical protein
MLMACSEDKPGPSAANGGGGGPASGVGAPVLTAGIGGSSGAGSAAQPAGAGGSSQPVAGRSAAGGAGGTSDAGTAGAGGAAGTGPVSCKYSDNPLLEPDDADGGVDPSCFEIPRTIIAENCIGSICHHNGKFQNPAGGLDLMSPCIADRMVGVTSRCQGLPLIDPEHPELSFLLNKLEREMPTCGESMPWTGQLEPQQVRCMNAWVHAIVRQLR